VNSRGAAVVAAFLAGVGFALGVVSAVGSSGLGLMPGWPATLFASMIALGGAILAYLIGRR
jgi:hypothetical protein